MPSPAWIPVFVVLGVIARVIYYQVTGNEFAFKPGSGGGGDGGFNASGDAVGGSSSCDGGSCS